VKFLNFAPEREPYRAKDAYERSHVVPSRHFSQVKEGEDREDYQRHDLLDDLELVGGEFSIANPICGNLKAIFRKRYQPAHDDHQHQRPIPEPQMSVPRNRHKGVRAEEQRNG
jgi:hypothetical protein